MSDERKQCWFSAESYHPNLDIEEITAVRLSSFAHISTSNGSMVNAMGKPTNASSSFFIIHAFIISGGILNIET